MSEERGERARRRRSTAQALVASRRASFGGKAVDFNCLVRVYLLDGSSKVLQMSEESTAAEVLSQLKYNMDLVDISTHALFRVVDKTVRRVELPEKIKDVLTDPTDSGQEVKLLFRSWITAKCGGFEKQVFQDNTRHKDSTTALWICFMEASFMCFAGKYYLSEDEAVMLGCLKMQAESGDFNPEVHTIENIKLRVALRFPSPARNKMQALMSPTLAGSGLGDSLALRVQHLYARIAGKHKAEAQIEFLWMLRAWCPFYGATFFPVQCQFDDGQSETEPPVTSINAAVGPLAIFLITNQEPPMILRHPYKRILKWIAYKDKHIFHYWVIKAHLKISDIEDAQALHNEQSPDEDFNPQSFCDCVYLVLPSSGELEYLVRSYVNLLRDVMPKLKGAKGDLLPASSKAAKRASEIETGVDGGVSAKADAAAAAATVTRDVIPENPIKKRATRFEKLFKVIGTYSEQDGDVRDDVPSPQGSPRSSITSKGHASGNRRRSLAAGSGIDADSDNDDNAVGYGDDSALVSKSLFQSIYKSTRNSIRGASGDEKNAVPKIPSQIKFAASMSELQRIAMEERFSDDESSSGETQSSDEESHVKSRNQDRGRIVGGIEEPKTSPSVQRPTEGTFTRVSRILFGGSVTTPARRDVHDSSSESDDGSVSENED